MSVFDFKLSENIQLCLPYRASIPNLRTKYLYLIMCTVYRGEVTNSFPMHLNANTLAENSLFKRILATFTSCSCMHKDSIFLKSNKNYTLCCIVHIHCSTKQLTDFHENLQNSLCALKINVKNIFQYRKKLLQVIE